MPVTVLKLGWEFPPHNQGGLGVACEGLVKGLIAQGASVILVLPHHETEDLLDGNVRLVSNQKPNYRIWEVSSPLKPYHSAETYQDHSAETYQVIEKTTPTCMLYGKDIFATIARYVQAVEHIATEEKFDIIHAHDWMTFDAGIAVKKKAGKQLVAHVHATEFDRGGGNNVHQEVYNIERRGMEQADKVIAVSHFAKQTIMANYGIPNEKIAVVHNALTLAIRPDAYVSTPKKHSPVILFLGRLTLQKGPDYFLDVAKKILAHRPDITFVIAGTGDMQTQLIENVARSGIADKIFFTGFLRGKNISKAYRMADVYIMPSVSEPFGITPLEALAHGTPTIISKQSGVSEVITACLKADFWDIHKMAGFILAILDYPPLKQTLSSNGYKEIKKFDWQEVAKKCINVYKECMS